MLCVEKKPRCVSRSSSFESRTAELKRLREGSFLFVKHLGSGAYGRVDLVQDDTTGEQLAVKTALLPPAEHNPSLTTLREISALTALRGVEHVVQLVAFHIDTPERRSTIYMEAAETTLANKIKENAPKGGGWGLTREARTILYEVTCAMRSINAAGVWHRDLKPENVLIMRDGGAKVADFGLSRDASSSK